MMANMLCGTALLGCTAFRSRTGLQCNHCKRLGCPRTLGRDRSPKARAPVPRLIPGVCCCCPRSMRRFVANAITLVMLVLFFAPAIMAAVPQPLPACCRRGGAHHCAMMADMMLRSDGIAIRCNNPCPMRQAPQIGTSIAALVVSQSAEIILRAQLIIVTAYCPPDSPRILTDRQRGPPQTLLG